MDTETKRERDRAYRESHRDAIRRNARNYKRRKAEQARIEKLIQLTAIIHGYEVDQLTFIDGFIVCKDTGEQIKRI